MEQSTEKPESSSSCLPREWALLWIIGLVLILAVSRQSLWIDEACTAAKASASSLHDWWGKMIEIGGSDLQMPFYLIYVWAFARFFGSSEWALRAAGLIWLVPGLVAMASGFSRPIQRTAVMLVAVTNAFVWYYAGEARPYAMQLGASCLIFAALHRLSRDQLSQRKQCLWLSGFLSGILILCGSSLLGVIWSIGALTAAFILIPRRRLLDLGKTGWLRLALTVLLLLALGLYYRWTLSAGGRGSAAGKTDWKTVAFVFYEQLGLTGLGPGRIELRMGGLQTLRPYFLSLAVYFLLVVVLVINGTRKAMRMEPVQQVRALALAVALPALLLFGIGFATHFRVLGRHFTPLMPVWFCLLALGLATLWSRPGWIGKTVLTAYFLFSIYSCLSVELAGRHQRDDYRDAARSAKLALGLNQVVWWNAAKEGTWYYMVPLAATAPEKNKALLLINPPMESLAKLEKPNVVITSKPDLFDSTGAMAEYLTRGHYRPTKQFPAFTVWHE